MHQHRIGTVPSVDCSSVYSCTCCKQMVYYIHAKKWEISDIEIAIDVIFTEVSNTTWCEKYKASLR